MKAELVEINGVHKICINGEIYNPVSFRSFWPQPNTVNNFEKHGFRLMSIFPSGILCSLKVPYSQFGEVWEGEGKYNWENLRKQIDMFVENAPNAYFSLMVHLDTRDWFLKENPECSDTFKYLAQTCGYQKWRESAARFMCDLIDYIDEHYPEKVYAVFLFAGGTCEWYTSDDKGYYHPLKEQVYQNWLSDKKTKLPNFEELHNTDYGIFRHPEKRKEAIRYWRFHNEIVTDTISWFAKIAKEHTNNTKLVGVFYGYLTGLGSSSLVPTSHNELSKLLNDENIDILFSPASYKYRKLNSTSAFHLPVDSIRLHKKLYFHEIDNTTHISNKNVYARALQYYAHERFATMDQTVMYSRRESALAMSKANGYWWFDMFSGWYDDAELMKELEKIKNVTDTLFDYSMASNSEVAVFVDEESNYYTDYNTKLLESIVISQIEELNRMGLPWDCYVNTDITYEEMPHDQYKLYIFLNLFKPDEKMLNKISELKAHGKSMLFVYAPGIITNTGFSIEAMNELTGIKLEELEEMGETHLIVKQGEYNRSGKDLCFGMHQILTPMFSAEEEDCSVVVGRYKKSGKAGLVVKERKNKNGFDAWSAVGSIPGAVLKELARKAGAFVYSETDEPIYANRSMIGYFSHTGGKRVLKVPYEGKLMELYTKKEYLIENGRVNLEFKPDEMKLFVIIGG